jgi:hypothetical protein
MTEQNSLSEIWKDIKYFEGLYQISNFGNIKRLKNSKEKLLKPSIEKKGYLKIRLSKNCKVYSFKIHRLVAIYFIENKQNLKQVNHLDGNKLNNNFTNLEWVSNRENINHYYLNINKSSKYPGVSFKKDVNKWQARIRIDKVRYNLGNFLKEEDAAKAYKNAQLMYNIKDKYTNE